MQGNEVTEHCLRTGRHIFLNTGARRTVLTGTSCLLDALVLCPGLHRQQNAVELNAGEYPTCGDMHIEWVFRVENPATVLFLQKVARTGYLTTLEVTELRKWTRWQSALKFIYDFEEEAALASLAHFTAVILTIMTSSILLWIEDWWALSVLIALATARLINVIVIRRRAEPGWRGSVDTGNRDLLILVSQDRWVRLRGAANDVKTVTAGQWLRPPTFIEDSATAFATLLVYWSAALAGNAEQQGKLLLLVMMIGSVSLLGITNSCCEVLKMHGRIVKWERCSEQYESRTRMVDDLLKPTTKKAWASRLGVRPPDTATMTSGVDDTEAALARAVIRQRTARGGQIC